MCSVVVHLSGFLTVPYYLRSFKTYKTSLKLLCYFHTSCVFYCVTKYLIYVAKMFFYQSQKKKKRVGGKTLVFDRSTDM